MKDTETTKSLATPLGRGKTGIESGPILDFICESIEGKEEFDIAKSPAHRFSPAKDTPQYIRRKNLTPEQTEQALDLLDITLHQLFCLTGNGNSLTTDEQTVLSELENLPTSALTRAIEIIRSLQGDVWWLPFTDGSTDNSFRARMDALTYHRFGWLTSSVVDTNTYPYLAKYIPYARLHCFYAADIPYLAEEMDVPITAFTSCGLNIANYSLDPAADKAFCEFKFLSRNERRIAAIAIHELFSERG